MRQYETGFLVSPQLSDKERGDLLLQMAEIVKKKKGKILREDSWGKRRLAYPIGRFEEAVYVFFLYEGEADVSSELERRFKQTDAILRYLTVKKDEKVNVRKKVDRRSEEEARKPKEEKAEPEKETADKMIEKKSEEEG